MIYKIAVICLLLCTQAYAYTFDHTVLNIPSLTYGPAAQVCETPSGGDITVTSGGSWESTVENAVAGNRIFFRAGSYTASTLNIPNGTAGSRILLKSYNCEAVTVNAFIVPGNYTTVEGFSLTKSSPSESNDGTVNLVTPTTGAIVKNNNITGAGNSAVYIGSNQTNLTITGNAITRINTTLDVNIFYIRAARGTNVVISGNKFTNATTFGIGDMIQAYNWAGDYTFSRNWLAVQAGREYFDIKYSQVGSSNDQMILSENYFEGTTQSPNGECIIAHNASDIGVVGGYSYTITVQGNYFNRCPSSAIFHSVHDEGFENVTLRTLVFDHNVVVSTAAVNSIFITSDHAHITNNTFISGIIKLGSGTLNPADEVLTNNIFYQSVFQNPTYVDSCSFNTLYQTSSNPTCTNTLASDPLFTNIVNNWTLQAGSPSRSSGNDGLHRGAVQDDVLSITITSPTTAIDYASHIPVTTVSGIVTGSNIAAITWTCTACTVTSGIGTFTPPSTFVINGLQTNIGANVVTVTVWNTSNVTSTDQITITLTTPNPDTTTGLIYRLPFDEGQGSVAVDATGLQGNTNLTGNFSWQPGLISGTSVQFNGTGVGTLSNNLLGSLATLTLMSHVQLTGPGGAGGGTIINIGDYIGLRIYPDRIRGFYHSGAGNFSGIEYLTTIGAGWVHVAYTHNSTERKLYFNGILVASSTSSAVVYTGFGSNTTVGNHATGAAGYELVGRLEETRAFNRVLSAADIAAVVSESPSPPVITITLPVTGGVYNTSMNQVSLAGTVVDNVSVASVTVSCSTCNPVLTNSAAIVSGSTWSKSNIVLGTAPSTNVFTIKATDDQGNVSQVQLTVVYTVTPPTEGAACTRWASNNGSGNGLTVDTPYTISQYWAQSSTAKVLCLKDDTYIGVNNMITPSAGIAGTSVSKIIVRAINDGKVLINAQNTKTPVFLDTTNQWFIISGINAANGLTNVYNIIGANNLLQRTIGWNGTSGQSNTAVYSITGSNSTAEDCAGWGDNIRTVFSGSGLVNSPGWPYRRCWGEFNDHPTGTSLKGATFRIGVGQGVENVIGTVNRTGD